MQPFRIGFLAQRNSLRSTQAGVHVSRSFFFTAEPCGVAVTAHLLKDSWVVSGLRPLQIKLYRFLCERFYFFGINAGECSCWIVW